MVEMIIYWVMHVKTFDSKEISANKCIFLAWECFNCIFKTQNMTNNSPVWGSFIVICICTYMRRPVSPRLSRVVTPPSWCITGHFTYWVTVRHSCCSDQLGRCEVWAQRDASDGFMWLRPPSRRWCHGATHFLPHIHAGRFCCLWSPGSNRSAVFLPCDSFDCVIVTRGTRWMWLLCAAHLPMMQQPEHLI